MPHAIAQPDPRLLAWEANHRFLNTLTALHGLLMNDFSRFPDPSVRQAVAVFSSRIQAFADVHRTLGVQTGEPVIDAAAHLARLCEELCVAHLAPRGLLCEVRLEQVVLPRETCLNLGLIVVELVTNAAKHAFVGRTGGKVWVILRRSERSWICQVADNGAGLRPGPGGDGMKLVRGLAAYLGASLQVDSDTGGVTTTLRLPDRR